MMKKYIYIAFLGLITFEIIVSKQLTKESNSFQEKHQYFLDNSPFRHSKIHSKKERKKMGIPPNKYYEDEWELTMNPHIGRPTPENLIEIQKDIISGKFDRISSNKSVPGDSNNFWIERGPNNVGGRTKALLFDPNDLTNETVFAGGVSGGLWKNTNISNVNSSWTLINDLSNVSVSSITVDPLNPNIFYLGTGESYTNGDGVGNGVWKSTDRGNTWTHIFGGFDGAIRFESNALVTVNSPSTIAGDYPAIQASFGPALTTISGDLVWVNDGSDNPTLGCFDLINASSIFGKIAVIQRGTCLFVEKVRFAQNAGAKAVLMINNVSGAPILMGGSNFDDIEIPSVMVSQADGLKITSAMKSNVNVTFSSKESVANGIFLIPGKSHINDIIAVNNNGSTEIFVAVGDSFYSGTSSPLTFFGSGDVGVYKSIDNGNNWTRMYLPPTPSGNFYVPQDLEYGSNNTLWVSTTYTVVNNDGGGTILSSTDHENFISKYSFSNGRRTELAISKSNPNLLYAVSHLSNFDTTTGERIAPFVSIVKTTDAFNTSSNLPLPNDAYSGIPDDDFTNTQSWFDLAIEVNPSSDQIVYAGGINWHRSINGGNSWTQFSNSYGGSHPNIHPDQHGLVFASPSILLIGNDGGVAYSNNGGSTISHRINNYNVTQFYHMAVAPTSYAVGEYFVAGSQDNGTQLFKNATSGITSSEETQGGDGAYCFFDQDGTDKYFISNYIYNQYIKLTRSTGTTFTINSEETENGDFICQQALDSKLNILYSNYSSGTNYAIRRYTITNLNLGLVSKTSLTNTLLTSSPTAFKVSPYTTTSTTLIVGLKTGKILKLTNANSTPFWTDISSSDIVGSISDIEFGSTEQELFVTIHNYGVKSIWYTSNGGTSWVNKEGNLPDMPVKCILRNPLRTEQVIIGTELGTWWTQNFSEVSPIWYYGSNGMNSVKVTNLEMRNDNKVYASTYGRGVFSGQFTSTDGTVGIDDLVTNTLTVYPNPASEFVNFNSKIELKKPHIQVFDLNNKLVAKYFSNSNGKSYKINVSDLNTGIYILRVTSDFQTFSSKIIVE